jgi:3-oxoacyl-[acyl-carrier-protein] synthase-3
LNTKIKNIDIVAIASCLPQNEFKFETLYDSYGKEEVNKIIKTTGISSINIADKMVTSSDLCEEAAKIIINELNIDVNSIDGLIFVSQTPDYLLPQTSHILQHKLGLSLNCFCLDIRLGCSGFIHGLFQASLLINSGSYKRILVLAGDITTSLISNKDRASRMVFGDAGTATLVEKGECEYNFSIYSDGSGYNQLIVPSGGFRYPKNNNSSILKEAEDGNWRSDENLYMDGSAIFNFVLRRVPSLLNEIIINTNWEKSDIDTFAIHQANKFIVEYIAKKIQVDQNRIPVVVDGFGNTGPSSIPLLFSEIGNNLKLLNKLNKVVLAGFGVGLSWAGLSCNLNNTSFFKPIRYKTK